MISHNQRNISRPLIRNKVIHPIVRRRSISPLKIQPRNRPRTGPRRPLQDQWPHAPQHQHPPLRPRRPSRPHRPPARPTTRNQRHINSAPCPVRSFSLLSNCTTAVPGVSATPLFVTGAVTHPAPAPSHPPSQSPSLPHRHHLRRAPQRRQRLIRHAVLPHAPSQRLHIHQPRGIHSVAIQPQRRPRHLRRRSPRRQRRRSNCSSAVYPPHIQIRNSPAIHPRPRAVHMSIRHQRRLHGNRRQSRSRHRRKPHSKQKHSPNQAHQTPCESAPRAHTQPEADPSSTIQSLRCTSSPAIPP